MFCVPVVVEVGYAFSRSIKKALFRLCPTY